MKKDYNYIAGVEKAVAEKYGKTAVQDIRSEWSEENEKEYLKQLKEANRNRTNTLKKKRLLSDEIEITKRPLQKKNDRTCPICKTYSFSTRDDLYMNRFECCFRCYIDFVERTEEKWKTGWRPNEEQLATALGRRK